MQILTLNDIGEVELDKIWLKTNDILWRIYERDNIKKPGDTQARKREKAFREYLFIYKVFNPESEYVDFDEVSRFKKASKLTGVPIEIRRISIPKATAKDPDKFEEKPFIKDDLELQEAVDEYRDIINSLISVRLYNAAKFSVDRKITYLGNFDPGAVDKTGKLLMTPKQHSDAVGALETDLTNLTKFSNKMKEEMGAKTRTKSTLEKGLREDRYTEHSEANPLAIGSPDSIDTL